MWWVALVGATFAVLMAVGSAGADTQTKFYGASVTPSAVVAGQSSVSYTLTLTNEADSVQTLGSANFWAPAGWTVNSVPSSPVLSTGSHSWNISEQSGATAPDTTTADAVEFRAASNADALAPGESVSATVQATAACVAGPATWQTESKQANDFSGVGNDFQPEAGDVATTVTVGQAGLAGFVFDSIGTQQVGVSFNVTVTAYDACGNVATDYNGGATLSGTLTGVSNPYPALSWNHGVGTESLTAVHAQFSAKLHIEDGTSAADSNGFEVADKAATCDSSGSCDVQYGATTFSAQAPSGSQTLQVGLLSGDVVGSSFTGCTSGAPLPGEEVATVDPSGYTSPFTITLTYGKSIAPGTGVANFVVCKSSDNGATWEPLGLCKEKNPAPPCIASRHRTGVGALVETLLVSPEDPAWGTS